MHLTGWHLLLVISSVAGWTSGETSSIQVPEEMRCEDGRSTPSEERVTANSKPEKHQQFSSSHFRDSASDNSLVSLHRVREAFGICCCCCCWEEVDIGTLARCTGLPGCTSLGNVAARRTVRGEVSLPRWPCLSLFAQSSTSSRLSSIQKCSLVVTYGRMDSTRSKRRWISKSRKSWVIRVPWYQQATNHIVNNVAELNVNTW